MTPIDPAKSSSEISVSRRDALKSMLLTAGALGSGPVFEMAEAKAQRPNFSTKPVFATSTMPVAHTQAGDVRGYIRNTVVTFKGIPYADTTASDNRFAAPQAPQPWKGTRISMQYGAVSPQAARDGWAHGELAWLLNWDDGHQGEDCLCLNVWTPAVDGKKRPVMVWLHGGGFTAGSSQELRSYDGENLARRGDVVLVSVNHRLGVTGFLNVSALPGGEALPANAGMLDLVAALQWVRDNIANFGGDSNCVTIFGQSGGGGKVNALMSMPGAAGLFHRAIVQSGLITHAASVDESRQFTEKVLVELKMRKATVSDLRQLPIETLVGASTRMLARIKRDHTALPTRLNRPIATSWGPVLDGNVLPSQPSGTDPKDPGYKVPLMVGTVRNEFTTGIDHPEWVGFSFADAEQRLRPAYGDRANSVLETFRKCAPNATALDIWSRVMTASVRRDAIAQAQAKAATDGAAYLYWFCWDTPVLDGRALAYHCSELPFVFANTERDVATEGNPEARSLAEKVSAAWLQFARNGDPNGPSLSHWPAVTPGQSPTMIFDRECTMRIDPDKEEQAAAITT